MRVLHEARVFAQSRRIGISPQHSGLAEIFGDVRIPDALGCVPGCGRPAECADIDHTVSYPLGPTHAAKVISLCRSFP